MNRDKVRGMMLGVAIGDQLGMPHETNTMEKIMKRGKVIDYEDPLPDHKWFGGMKSRWTDDTQLTLAVAESLIAKKCIDMDDMAERHVASLQNNGDLGWGKSTKESVLRLAQGIHWSKSGNENGYGNGVEMKIAPVGVYYLANFLKKPFSLDRLSHSEMSSVVSNLAAMTHCSFLGVESGFAQVIAIDFCFYQKASNFNPDRFLSAVTTVSMQQYDHRKEKYQLILDWSEETLTHRFMAMQHLPGIEKIPIENKLQIFGGANSYVYNSLPFCYSMFMANPTSIETLYDTVNAGGDTDTNGSIVGALLGALNGTSIFPQYLIEDLWQRDRILDTAERLCDAFENHI